MSKLVKKEINGTTYLLRPVSGLTEMALHGSRVFGLVTAAAQERAKVIKDEDEDEVALATAQELSESLPVEDQIELMTDELRVHMVEPRIARQGETADPNAGVFGSALDLGDDAVEIFTWIQGQLVDFYQRRTAALKGRTA